MIMNPTVKQLEAYHEKYGNKAKLSIEALNGMVGFVEAIQTEIGAELLKDDIEEVGRLIEKIIAETISPEETAELRYLKNKRIPRISHKLSEFYRISSEIAKTKID